MKTIKSTTLHAPKQMDMIDVPMPTASGPDQAIVKLRLGGICGSDLGAFRGVFPLVTYPRVLGHELVVDIVEPPSHLPEWENRRAVIEPLVRCGRCTCCRKGRYNACLDLQVMGVHTDGGFRDFFSIDSKLLHPIDDDLDDDTAVLAEPTSIAYRAVERSEVKAGSVAVVLGAGTIGLLIASLLINARGCRVIVADKDTFRLDKASQIGAIPVPLENVEKTLRSETGGDMADVVFEATGHPSCTLLTTEFVGYTGRIVLIGWNEGPTPIDTVTLMRKEAELVTSRNSNNAFVPVIRMLSHGMVDPEILITHRFPMTEIGTALDLLDLGYEPSLKIVLHG